MADRPLSRQEAPSAQRPASTPWIDVACVLAVLLAVALLLAFVALNWSNGSSRFLG